MVDVFYYMALFMVDDMMASKCPKAYTNSKDKFSSR